MTTPKNDIAPVNFDDYPVLLSETKSASVPRSMRLSRRSTRSCVGLYWDIGQKIVDRQESVGWGKAVVERLSVDLRREFPGVSGFSVQNL